MTSCCSSMVLSYTGGSKSCVILNQIGVSASADGSLAAEGDVRSADPGLPPMGNRASTGETMGVCEAIEGAGPHQPPGEPGRRRQGRQGRRPGDRTATPRPDPG